MPKVSVILPIYNVAPYLDDTFNSLLKQSMTDFEVIAVNDGSTDDSQKIVEKYVNLDSRIISFQQENLGQSVARNTALKYATGEYIYMMDADDTISPETLNACCKKADQTQADFLFFDGDICMENGAEPIPWDYKRTYLCKENTPYIGEQLLRKMIETGKHNCVVWLLFIRKSYLDHINLSFYPGIIHEDELFTTILTLKSEHIFCLKQTLVMHRVRKASTMGKKYSRYNIHCYMTVFDELFSFQNSFIIRQFAQYTLSKVFYTGHSIPLADKFSVFLRAILSGYLKYIGLKSILVFWLKR